MYSKQSVEIPPGKTNIFKKIYVRLETGRKYNSEKRQTRPDYTTIGKLDLDVPGRMFPNENYWKLFSALDPSPAENMGPTVKIGTYHVLSKLFAENPKCMPYFQVAPLRRKYYNLVFCYLVTGSLNRYGEFLETHRTFIDDTYDTPETFLDDADEYSHKGIKYNYIHSIQDLYSGVICPEPSFGISNYYREWGYKLGHIWHMYKPDHIITNLKIEKTLPHFFLNPYDGRHTDDIPFYLIYMTWLSAVIYFSILSNCVGEGTAATAIQELEKIEVCQYPDGLYNLSRPLAPGQKQLLDDLHVAPSAISNYIKKINKPN